MVEVTRRARAIAANRLVGHECRCVDHPDKQRTVERRSAGVEFRESHLLPRADERGVNSGRRQDERDNTEIVLIVAQHGAGAAARWVFRQPAVERGKQRHLPGVEPAVPGDAEIRLIPAVGLDRIPKSAQVDDLGFGVACVGEADRQRVEAFDVG